MYKIKQLALAATFIVGSALPGVAATLGADLTVTLVQGAGSAVEVEYTQIVNVVDDVSNPEIVQGDGSAIGDGYLYPGESFDFFDTGITVSSSDFFGFDLILSGWSGVLIDVTTVGGNVNLAPGDAGGTHGISADGKSVEFRYTHYGTTNGGSSTINLVFAPTTPPPNEVPLPAGAWLLGSGIVALTMARRRRKA